MRIITGKYKGKRFDVPRSFKARPTTDFAKENIFNVMKGYVDFEETKTLDLFGGTGSIALEFLSRGCPRVVTVEVDKQHFAFISAVCRQLQDAAIKPLCTDALRFIARCNEQFDLVFADPPYAMKEIAELPERVMKSNLLSENGIFVLEHGKNNDFSSHPDFVEHRAYGSVNFSIFQKHSVKDTTEAE